MNPTRGMLARLQQQQQQRVVRERTHEPICVKETRICWIEFGASLTCLVLGIILVFAGVSADSSAVGSSGGSQAAKPAGILAVTYIGVALLIIGAVLLIVFGIHFHRVKSRLDVVKAERFAQLGIQPSSRYQQLPEQSAAAANLSGPPRPPLLPLPSQQQEQQQQQQQQQSIQQPTQQQQQVLQEQRQEPSQMSSSRLQPMPSYREGAFYNLGFLGDEAEVRPPPKPTVATISTGRAPPQQQPPGLLHGRHAPMQSPTGETSRPISFAKGAAIENNSRGHFGQYNSPSTTDQDSRSKPAHHNPPPSTDHARRGPSTPYDAQPPADYTRHGLSTQYDASLLTDRTRHGPSAQYSSQQSDEYPSRSQYAQRNAPSPANYAKHDSPPSTFVPPHRAKRAGFVAPVAENFSVGFSDAPPAGAVGGVQSSRSYHSGFHGGATGQGMSTSASGQDFQSKAAISESSRQGFRPGRPYRESPNLPTWQQQPVETPPPQRSPPPGYALDPLSLMRQPLREGREFQHRGEQQPRPDQQQQPAVSQQRRQQASGYRSSQI